MSLPPAIPFSPHSDQIDDILAAIRRDDLSFLDVAEFCNTTPDALADWMAQPDIMDRLKTTAGMTAFRTRLIATEKLPRALRALEVVLHNLLTPPEFDEEADADTILRAEALRTRKLEISRKAATSIIRLCNIGTPSVRRAAEQPASEAAPPDVSVPPRQPVCPPATPDSIQSLITHTLANLPEPESLSAPFAPASTPSVPPLPSDPSPLHTEGVNGHSRGLPTDGSAEVGTPGPDAPTPAHAEGVLGAPDLPPASDALPYFPSNHASTHPCASSDRPLQGPCSLVDQPFTAGSATPARPPHRQSPAGRFSGLPDLPALAAEASSTSATALLDPPLDQPP